MGAVRIWISAFTRLNRPFPGAKLDVPRLAAPRGPARGRARANRPSLSYRMFESHSCMRSAPEREQQQCAGVTVCARYYSLLLNYSVLHGVPYSGTCTV